MAHADKRRSIHQVYEVHFMYLSILSITLSSIQSLSYGTKAVLCEVIMAYFHHFFFMPQSVGQISLTLRTSWGINFFSLLIVIEIL